MIRPTSRSWMIGGAALLCLASDVRADVGQSLSGRLQVGVAYDTNVLEELAGETGDGHLSIFGSVDHRLTISERLALESIARVGLLRYGEVEGDSRVLGQGSWRLAYATPQGVAAGGRLLLDGRDYADSASTRGYALVKAELFLRGPVGPLMGEIAGARTLLDYKVTPGQEQRGNRIDGSLSRRFLRHVVVGVRAGAGSFRFNRRVVRVAAGSPMVEAFNQRDEFIQGGVDVQYLRGFFVSAGYSYLHNDSNSFGNTYAYHRLDVTARYRLRRVDLSLGLIARAETRHYADDLSSFDVINFDSEREENNHVIGELGRPLREDLSVKVRAGWHRNESVFRDRSYSRFQVETHLEWQF